MLSVNSKKRNLFAYSSLAWAITVHKSQGLTLKKGIIDIGENEYSAGLSFVAISRVCSLNNILPKPFTFERLRCIKKCTSGIFSAKIPQGNPHRIS